MYNKYNSILLKQFKNDIELKGALEKACIDFINKNAVTGKAQKSTFTAEALAVYCHLLLKKSNKNLEEDEVEPALDQIMSIFQFIQDKDVFEGFYKRRLAERLV